MTTPSKAEPVKDAPTKVEFEKVGYVQGGGDLTATSSAAGANSLIVATGGTITGSQQLLGQQTLQGGASTINVQGVKLGTIAPFTAPGTRPTFFNDQESSTISVLGCSEHIAGIDLKGADPVDWGSVPFNAGITDDCSCTPVLNTFIENVNINQFAFAGISFGDGSEVTIRNTAVSNIGGYGIQFFDGNTVTITNTVVNQIGAFGIAFGNGNIFTINQTQISEVCCAGIYFGRHNTGEITNTTITDAVLNGIVGDSFNTVTIAGVNISHTGAEAILFNYRNTVSIRNTSATTASPSRITTTGSRYPIRASLVSARWASRCATTTRTSRSPAPPSAKYAARA